MALCMASKYEWGGHPRCTLPKDHGGDEHIAEGLKNRNGIAPIVARWPAEPVPEPDQWGTPLVWHRTAAGRHRATCNGVDVYTLVRVSTEWIVTRVPGGGIAGKGSNLDLAKGVARHDFAVRFPNGVMP